METWNWENCLKQWSRRQIELTNDYEETKAQLPLDVLESGDLSCPGATEEEISMAEARLEITFPPSYRNFLKFSNGTRSTVIDMEEYGVRLYSTEEIDFYADCDQETIDTWIKTHQNCEPITDEEYLNYGKEPSDIVFRIEYLQTALLISSGDPREFYILNPQIVTSNGEWEAWALANYPLAVVRYRSFWEMIEAEGNYQAY